MKVLEFKRYNVIEEIVDALRDEKDEVVEALVIGKKKGGGRFSLMTETDNIAELIGYLEAIKTDLTLELIEMADRTDEE
jgi:CBS domain containing-hemolysin-like protein